jgi:tRNA threonylcarbamoyladenosine biosynthesis protein TsaB
MHFKSLHIKTPKRFAKRFVSFLESACDNNQDMLVFALDTSMLQGIYGWVQTVNQEPQSPVEAFASCSAPARPGHAETLLDRIADLLKAAELEFSDIDLLVYGRGPGTFTGLRIGLSTVKGLALACDIPTVGISSLEALAFSSCATGFVAPLIDARRHELFAALYKVHFENGWPVFQTVVDEFVGPVGEVVGRLGGASSGAGISLVGNGIAPYRLQLIDAFGKDCTVLPENTWAANPFWMARIGYERFLQHGAQNIDSIEPVYIREPDARLPKIPLR